MASCTLGSATQFAILDLPLLSEADIDCVLEADDCAGALDCFGFTIGGSGCDGDNSCLDDETLAACRAGIPVEIRCAAWDGNGGPACITGSGGASCGGDTCETDGETCDGAERQDCDGGVLQVTDCDHVGLDCAVVGEDAECFSVTADSCSAPDRCDGALAIHCQDGVETTTDCSERLVGGSCFLDSGDAYCGFADECDPELLEPVETCDGSMLRYCLLGASVTVDCADIGFDGCVSDTAATGCR